MKIYLVALVLLAAGCKDAALSPDQEFEVTYVGRNSDCGLPMLRIDSNVEAAKQLFGASYGPVYMAQRLDTTFQKNNLRLLIKARPPAASEYVLCKAYGPSYDLVTITSARLK